MKQELKDFFNKVENADNWNDIEPEEYTKYLECVGLYYSDYDDPDYMWDDFRFALKQKNII